MKLICQSCGYKYDKKKSAIEPVVISMTTEIMCSWDDVTIDKNICWDCFVRLRDFIRKGKYVIVCDLCKNTGKALNVIMSVVTTAKSDWSGLLENKDLCKSCFEDLKKNISEYIKQKEKNGKP